MTSALLVVVITPIIPQQEFLRFSHMAPKENPKASDSGRRSRLGANKLRIEFMRKPRVWYVIIIKDKRVAFNMGLRTNQRLLIH